VADNCAMVAGDPPYLGLQLVPLTARRARDNTRTPIAVLQLARTAMAPWLQRVLPGQPGRNFAGLCDVAILVRFRRRSTGDRDPSSLLQRVEVSRSGVRCCRQGGCVGARELQLSIPSCALAPPGMSGPGLGLLTVTAPSKPSILAELQEPGEEGGG